ncbi:phosphoribosylanthranilate isomerase [Marinobacterium sediminicola]|uniref:N-(5'-phosphoribosyl)anthranilate isomerase n=1 Tax=Marinobacterium sediminicola TaxID=518898 RepID=A0ABY1RVU8_9GAMM|nr:phosphoribosylanthranilate isomerase [Marinobacterium sediminicola]ULG70633.1 phosphoribosylanthranilate isomerase [Marinobacterium sediminicola]SMR68803.1 phosphoribosylanthranilate isomerase [Marinobacterium sediminicola]
MTTRVKICGITSLGDALCAVEAGASALGFVFYEPSPRYVSPEVAADIIRQLPAFITTVGLFVNASGDEVERVLNETGLDLIQFHGDEPESFCRGFKRPYIKAFRVRPGLDVKEQVALYPTARGVLLDAYRPGVPGGTGEVFDWALIPAELAPRVILAGGLNPGNVAQAIAQVSPYAVDVSGGVEAGPGRKDAERIYAFMAAVKQS